MIMKKGATCILCGKWMDKGTEAIASKPKRGPEVYAHKVCVKLRKECERDRSRERRRA